MHQPESDNAVMCWAGMSEKVTTGHGEQFTTGKNGSEKQEKAIG
jgi:hypothetical protein